jgi:hypothetical protein
MTRDKKKPISEIEERIALLSKMLDRPMSKKELDSIPEELKWHREGWQKLTRHNGRTLLPRDTENQNVLYDWMRSGQSIRWHDRKYAISFCMMLHDKEIKEIRIIWRDTATGTFWWTNIGAIEYLIGNADGHPDLFHKFRRDEYMMSLEHAEPRIGTPLGAVRVYGNNTVIPADSFTAPGAPSRQRHNSIDDDVFDQLVGDDLATNIFEQEINHSIVHSDSELIPQTPEDHADNLLRQLSAIATRSIPPAQIATSNLPATELERVAAGIQHRDQPSHPRLQPITEYDPQTQWLHFRPISATLVPTPAPIQEPVQEQAPIDPVNILNYIRELTRRNSNQ